MLAFFSFYYARRATGECLAAYLFALVVVYVIFPTHPSLLLFSRPQKHTHLTTLPQAAVLTQNGYLRLDPAVMHVSCIHAGGLLARLGRPEVQACILGLEQYADAYSEAGAQAAGLRRVYEGVLGAGGLKRRAIEGVIGERSGTWTAEWERDAGKECRRSWYL